MFSFFDGAVELDVRQEKRFLQLMEYSVSRASWVLKDTRLFAVQQQKSCKFVKGSKDRFTFQIRHVGRFYSLACWRAWYEELTLILRLPATSPLNEGQCGMIYGKLAPSEIDWYLEAFSSLAYL